MIKKLTILLAVLLLFGAAALAQTYDEFLAATYTDVIVEAQADNGSSGIAVLLDGWHHTAVQHEYDGSTWRKVGENTDWYELSSYGGDRRVTLTMDTDDLLILSVSYPNEYAEDIQRYYRWDGQRWQFSSAIGYWYQEIDWAPQAWFEETHLSVDGDTLTRSLVITDSEGNVLYTRRLTPLPNVLTADELDLLHESSDEKYLTPWGYAVNECCDTSEEVMRRLFARLAPQGYSFIGGVLQQDGMWFLTEDAAHQRVLLCFDHRDGWHCTVSSPLPQDCGIGLENFTDALRIGRAVYGIRQYPNGKWGIHYMLGSDMFEVAPHYICYDSYLTEGSYLYGTHPWGDVTVMDWAHLPVTYEQAAAMLDCSHWATPNNPNPEDRLHQRVKASRSSQSYGKYLNGTPVYVIDMGGEWTHTHIDNCHGYMMTKYLAFGRDASHVKPALTKMNATRPVVPVRWFSLDTTELTASEVFNDLYIVGVSDRDGYIVWDVWRDEFGYIDSQLLWPGNG